VKRGGQKKRGTSKREAEFCEKRCVGAVWQGKEKDLTKLVMKMSASWSPIGRKPWEGGGVGLTQVENRESNGGQTVNKGKKTPKKPASEQEHFLRDGGSHPLGTK